MLELHDFNSEELLARKLAKSLEKKFAMGNKFI